LTRHILAVVFALLCALVMGLTSQSWAGAAGSDAQSPPLTRVYLPLVLKSRLAPRVYLPLVAKSAP
jgi:hypothetical protein